MCLYTIKPRTGLTWGKKSTVHNNYIYSKHTAPMLDAIHHVLVDAADSARNEVADRRARARVRRQRETGKWANFACSLCFFFSFFLLEITF